MRLEKHDIETLLPVGMALLSKKGTLNVKNMAYELSDNKLTLSMQAVYIGLPAAIDLVLSCFVKGGAVGIRIEKGYLDSVFMKGDILPFLKTLVKDRPHFCLEDRILYFYNPLMPVQSLTIKESGIELIFK